MNILPLRACGEQWAGQAERSRAGDRQRTAIARRTLSSPRPQGLQSPEGLCLDPPSVQSFRRHQTSPVVSTESRALAERPAAADKHARSDCQEVPPTKRTGMPMPRAAPAKMQVYSEHDPVPRSRQTSAGFQRESRTYDMRSKMRFRSASRPPAAQRPRGADGCPLAAVVIRPPCPSCSSSPPAQSVTKRQPSSSAIPQHIRVSMGV